MTIESYSVFLCGDIYTVLCQMTFLLTSRENKRRDKTTEPFRVMQTLDLWIPTVVVQEHGLAQIILCQSQSILHCHDTGSLFT